MANPIVTTIELTEENIANDSATLLGNTQNNGWETLAWGFWYYKKSAGIETKLYIASSTTPLGEGDFLKFLTGFLPYTVYVFQARCYYRKWNEELEDWDYIEIFGEWVEFTTHAYSTALQIFACNIDKNLGEVTFWGSINTPDDGYVVERGFEYGLTKTPTWKVSEEGNFSVGMFSLNASGLQLNQDFYVRTYLKTISGHYFYTGDGEDRGWAKFTTKTLNNNIAVLSNAGFFTDNEDFLRVFDKNGQENNAWKLPIGQITTEVTVDKEGNAYYGYKSGASYYVGKRRLIDGVLIDSYPISGYPRGVCMGYGDYLFTLETDTQAKNGVIYKRMLSDLSVIASIPLISTFAYFCGIIADSEDHVYIGRTTDPDRIEKYALYNFYSITGVVTDITILGDIDDGTLWQEDRDSYTEARDAETANYLDTEHTYLYIGQYYWNEKYSVMRSCLFFDTSEIPLDTEIIKIILKLYNAFDESVTDFNVVIQNGMPDYPNKPLQEGDYNKMHYSGNGGSINTVDWAQGEFAEIEFTEQGRDWINKEGITKLILRSDKDINGIEPTGDEAIDISSQEWAVESQRPTLNIKINESNFRISGDHTSEFLGGISIVIAGSTGNDGIYTVAEGGSYLDSEDTIIPVDEIISNPTVDGNITKIGNLTQLANINSPTPLTFGSISLSGNYVYAGAYFDLPSKTDKGLIAIEEWNPAGEWYSTDFSHVGGYKNKIIVQGQPYVGYSVALACYDSEGNQLWKTDIVRGINSIGGYPFPGGATLINLKAERRGELARTKLYGEITEIIE